MHKSILILHTMLTISNPSPVVEDISVPTVAQVQFTTVQSTLLSSKSFSLSKRYNEKFVNNVFRDNILLTLNYMSGLVIDKEDINWKDVEMPRTYLFSLQPSEVFAFHDQVLPEFAKNVVKTTNSRFNYQDGFKSDGYLAGDGVCHLASLMYWAAKEAGISAYAPTNHDFASINEVPKEYGVSIYNLPGSFTVSAKQNLYIQNTLDKPVTFIFNYDGDTLTVNVERSNS